MKKITFFFAFISLFISVSAVQAQSIADGTVVRQRGTVKTYIIYDGKKLPVKDSFTISQLVAPKTDPKTVDKTELDRYQEGDVFKISLPKIKGIYDMHEHFRDGGHMNVYASVAKKLGIVKTVFVPTGNAPDNGGYKLHTEALLKEQKKNPEQVIAFCTIDEADPNAPQIFTDCLDKGGKGLKILGGHPDLYDTPLDNDVMKQVFGIAVERDVPILVHVSIITLPQAKKEFLNLMSMYPNARVIFAHYCSTMMEGVNLGQCAEFLDQFPNMMFDTSMGGGIQRYFKLVTQKFTSPDDPTKEVTGLDLLRDFILKYQDRIVYGTDMILAGKGATTDKVWMKNRMMCDFSFLQEKLFKCPSANDKNLYPLVPGLDLPTDVLNKIFVENPKKFLKEE